jgi:hypothetical protein
MITDPDKSGETTGAGKSVFEGKEYDYVFNIDIDDNLVLKMPYKNDQVFKLFYYYWIFKAFSA